MAVKHRDLPSDAWLWGGFGRDRLAATVAHEQLVASGHYAEVFFVAERDAGPFSVWVRDRVPALR